MLKNTIVLILGLFLTINANSKILKVETVANSGAGSLRDQIAAALPNDTILINIKGTLIIQGPHLIFDKPLTIIGPTAAHFTIDVNSWQVIFDIPAGNIHMEGVRFTSPAFLCGDYVSVQQGTNLTLKNCVFENTQISGDGGAIKMMNSAVLNLDNCSFFNCSATGNGGAIFVDSGNTANVRNCTFFQNFTNGAGVGGAICNNGNVVLVNNTFLNNTSGGAIGHAVADNNSGAGSNTRIQNNIFTDVVAGKYPDLVSGNILNPWQMGGGNIYSFNDGLLNFIPIGGGTNDIFSVSHTALFLRATPVMDGYGLKYFTILNPSSPAVDNGTSGANVAMTDCRRAPRALNGTGAATPLADAGAVEFTPFTVTSNTGPGFLTDWSNFNTSTFTGPKYMDFDISGGVGNYVMSIILNNSASMGVDFIVDGFTQDGSVVAGPGNTPGTYTPASYRVNIQNSSANILSFVNTGVNSFISGLNLDNGNGVLGIRIQNGQIHIYGNHIISSASTGAGGINLLGTAISTIGGEMHYHRNVIGNQVNVGIHCQNDITNISGNFIGTNETGLTSLTNDKGILLQGNSGFIKGKFGFPSLNLISGNSTSQIEVASGFFDISGNIIGPDISGNNLLGTTARGILAGTGTNGLIGSTRIGGLNVIGGNSDGILLNGADGVTIHQNFIGISPNPGFPSIPNVTGINITNNGSSSHLIGDGTFRARNYICNNSSMGMYMENAPNHTIMGNFIGIKPDNAIAGNGSRGIHLVGFTTEGNDILGNVIGGHTSAGIDVNGAAGSGNISGNKIGTDSTGMVARPNGRGIQVAATGPNSQIIGNLISGNTNEGIHLDNSVHTIDGNLIGMNLDTTMALTNGGDGLTLVNTNNCNIFNNYIGGNGNNGILLGASNGNWIHGNHIGTNRNGMDFGNQLHGIALFFVSANNMIGGPAVADQNSIMHNLGAGIDVERETSVTGIRGNHFSQNGIKAILLNTQTLPTAPLVNDLNDADVDGPAAANVGNNGQNYPDAISAVFNAGTCTVTGTMNVDNTTANYLIQVYKVNSGNIDASGHGEGDTLIAEQTFNASGLNTFNFTMNVTGPVLGDILSLTTSKMISTNYETSEFSDTVMVRAPYTASIIDSADVLCNGAADGRLEVLAAGSANLPYTYQWHDGGGPIAGANASVYFGGPGTYFCVVTDAAAVVVNSDTVTIIEPPLLTVTPTSVDPTCSGTCDGTIVLSETGGTPPYQYSLNNGSTSQASTTFLGLCAGVYQIYVVDNNGCGTPTTGNDVTLIDPPIISISPVVSDETCAGLNDGVITLSGVGGTPSYTFQVDGGGFSGTSTYINLTPGNHTVDIMDANGCTSGGNVTILAGEMVTANFSFNNACEDVFAVNVIDLSSSSTGIASWNYTFTGASPSSATIPNVSNILFFTPGANNIQLSVISNGGCTAVTNQNVTIFPNPIVNLGADVSICEGTPYTHNATIAGGTPGFTNSWTPVGHFSDPTIEDAVVVSGIYSISGAYTHILTVSDVNGCIDADTMILTVNPLPTVNAGLDNSVCQGSPFTLAGTGSAISYTWDNSVTDGTPFTPVATTTYTVTGIDGNGCQATDQVIISIDIPYTVNAGTNFDICENASSFTLTGTTNAPTHTWTQINGSGSLVGSTLLNPTYNLVAPDTIQTSLDFVFQTPVNGVCPSQDDTVSVFLIEPPTIVAMNDVSVCSSGGTVLLSSTPTHSTSVMWTSSGSGIFNPTNITPNTNYDFSPADILAGSVNLTVTANATNVVCANATDNVLITILTSPIANAGANDTICIGQVYTLDGSSSTGTISNYSWNEVGVGNISSGASPIATVNPIVTTDYALITDNGTCLDYDTLTLNVISAPDATFSYGGTIFCENASNPTITTLMTAGGTFTMSPSPGNINSSTGEINLSTLGAGVYSIVYTLTSPCLADDTISISVVPVPIVNAGSDTSFCAGGTVNLNGSSTGINFTWSSFNGFFSNVNPTSDTPATTDTYTLVVTDGNGCSNTDTKLVTVNPIPAGTITGGGAFCEGDPGASLIVTANGYSGGGDWNNQFFHNSSPGAIATPPTGTYTLNGLGNSANNGVWTAVITDNMTGCVGNATGSVNILVNPEPAMSVSSPFNVCSSVSSFDMNSIFVPNIGGGTWSGTGVTGVNFNPFSIGSGLFDVVYTVSTGCDDTIQINVQAAPNPTISGLNSAYCITDAPFMPSGNPSGGLWSIDGAPFTTITTIDPSTFSTGTHTLSYQFTDGVTGCVGTTSPNGFVISPMPLDPIAVSNTSQSICGGTSLTLTVSNPNSGGTTIQWYSDAAMSINVGSTINFTTPVLSNSITYYAVAQNAGCKSNPVIFTITVNNTQVSAGADLTICPGTPAQLNLTSATGTISWSPGISLNDSTIQNPIATPNVNTTYVVTVTSGPCSSQDSVNVMIDGSNPDCGIVPSYNAFSPDGDGVNDDWIIDAILAHPDNRVTIFNRWGDKLVEFDDYDNINVVWDGKYKGEILPSGTYFYVIEYLDIQMQVSGWLQLTR